MEREKIKELTRRELAPNEDEKTAAVAVGLYALQMSLERKQEYLRDGIEPVNLPKSAFLLEDIKQIEYLMDLL